MLQTDAREGWKIEKENKQSSEENTETNKDEDDVVDESIESIPFISEPVKKKRTRSSK